jgi:predicted lipoprotein with Yx(FWY)xxD motif
MMLPRLSVLFAGTALLVAACGGGGGKTATSGTTASSTTAPAAARPTVNTSSNAKLGSILVDTSGRTLYVFDKDTGGKIACVASCVSIWPPLLVNPGTNPAPGAGVTAAIATVHRPDGGLQVTLAGRPMYVYSGDSAPGDTNGDGFGGIWHAARPAGVPESGTPTGGGAPASTPTTAPATTSTTSGGYGY